ncbi:MAG: DoxX family protein [Leptospirales bacterium]|nr:DoxX family protein [Leptospirales bacterium]
MRIVSWVLQLAAAFVLFCSLSWKLSGDATCVWIFVQLGAEPWGRYFAAAMELVSAFLLLVPRTAAFGAFMASSLTAGAIVSHIFRLGIVVQGDNGQLFFCALAVLLTSLALLWIHRDEFGLADLA